jgi:hypothetical protein
VVLRRSTAGVTERLFRHNDHGLRRRPGLRLECRGRQNRGQCRRWRGRWIRQQRRDGRRRLGGSAGTSTRGVSMRTGAGANAVSSRLSRTSSSSSPFWTRSFGSFSSILRTIAHRERSSSLTSVGVGIGVVTCPYRIAIPSSPSNGTRPTRH